LRSLRLAALALALAAAQSPAAQGLREALESGDLICEFDHGERRSLIADLVGPAQAADLLLVYESVGAEAAQVLSSAAPGRRPVLVRSTGKAVHFIERVGPSVRVTTLTRCEQRKWKNGVQACVRFAARHAWHFDALAAADPDGAFERLPDGASAGRCEPWQVD
jgi:hypothetical protein